jgi:hypothetical protein
MKPIIPILLAVAAQCAHVQAAQAQAPAPMQAGGTFEVRLTPQSAQDGPPWGRMRIEKVFKGQLQGTSTGEMLAAQTAVKGSAGYVALEQVSAELEGRKGSFFLQHSGTMDHGTPTLSVTVVPDSATGELTGLTGTMSIRIEAGQHYYSFTYRLPAR